MPQASRGVLPVCGAEERSKLGSERYSRDFHALFEASYPGPSLRESPPACEHRKEPLVPKGRRIRVALSLLTFFRRSERK